MARLSVAGTPRLSRSIILWPLSCSLPSDAGCRILCEHRKPMHEGIRDDWRDQLGRSDIWLPYVMESLSLLWGKTGPFHPLDCHMIDAGQTARTLLGSPTFSHTLLRLTQAADAVDDSQMLVWASFVTALHDIGKCHADFQGKGPPELVAPLEASGLRCQVQQVGCRGLELGGRAPAGSICCVSLARRRFARLLRVVIVGGRGCETVT